MLQDDMASIMPDCLSFPGPRRSQVLISTARWQGISGQIQTPDLFHERLVHYPLCHSLAQLTLILFHYSLGNVFTVSSECLRLLRVEVRSGYRKHSFFITWYDNVQSYFCSFCPVSGFYCVLKCNPERSDSESACTFLSDKSTMFLTLILYFCVCSSDIL